MKIFLIFTAVLLGFISCVSTKVVTEKKQQTESVDKPILWMQSYFKTINLRDSVLFYNSSEIRLQEEFFNQHFFVKDGAVFVVDSINKVSKTVPALTPGGWVDNNNQICYHIYKCRFLVLLYFLLKVKAFLGVKYNNIKNHK